MVWETGNVLEQLWASTIAAFEELKQNSDQNKAAHERALSRRWEEKKFYVELVEWRKTVEKDAEWKVATYGPDMFARHLADSFDALLASL